METAKEEAAPESMQGANAAAAGKKYQISEAKSTAKTPRRQGEAGRGVGKRVE